MWLRSRIRTRPSMPLRDLGTGRRLAAEARPTFSLLGYPVARNAVLGAGIMFPGEQEWLQLYPVALLSSVMRAVAEACAHHELPVGPY
jgi:hypothetical protein